MNRNRIIKVILGVLTVLPVVWFCVLFYQDGYARDYGIYRSRTLLLLAVVLLLCWGVLFFSGSFFCKKGIGKVQICNFVFLILTVASLGLWGNSAAVKDEDAEVKAVLEDYIKEEMDGKVLFLNLTEVPRSFYQNPSADAPYYDAQDYDWRYYNVSFYYEDQQDKEASGDYHWNAYMVKEDAEAAWKVVSLGES